MRREKPESVMRALRRLRAPAVRRAPHTIVRRFSAKKGSLIRKGEEGKKEVQQQREQPKFGGPFMPPLLGSNSIWFYIFAGLGFGAVTMLFSGFGRSSEPVRVRAIRSRAVPDGKHKYLKEGWTFLSQIPADHPLAGPARPVREHGERQRRENRSSGFENAIVSGIRRERERDER